MKKKFKIIDACSGEKFKLGGGESVMKVYILYEQYYDFCEVWDNILGVYDSEDKAVLAQIKEEEQEKYKINPEQCSTKIEEHDLL